LLSFFEEDLQDKKRGEEGSRGKKTKIYVAIVYGFQAIVFVIRITFLASDMGG
jgi:hypothetical protein